MLTNFGNTVFYTGVTNDLIRRTFEHKQKLIDGFTKRYNINKLIYYEQTEDVKSAIAREKFIKGKTRNWKINLIKSSNPKFQDMYYFLIGKDSSLCSE